MDFKCKRCGHEWMGRLKTLPKRCPNCTSTYWNKDRIRKVKQKTV